MPSSQHHDHPQSLYRWLGRALLGLAAIALFVGILLYVPRWLYPPVNGQALRGVLPDRRVELETNRLRLQSDARTGVLQGLAGLALLAGAVAGWRQLRHTIQATQNQHELSRSGQITERFTRAIDQLGRQDQLEVVLGGIYALERIARDSFDDDRGTIAEVLTAYVRTHAPWPPTSPSPDTASTALDDLPDLQVRAPDVQAAVTVLGRGGFPDAVADRLDLGGVDLRKATLADADLRKASLAGSRLEESNLSRAQLQEANLARVWLRDVRLRSGQLQEANLVGAQLQGVDLRGAQLQKADLSGAQLQGAYLGVAQLQEASLSAAKLQEAFLGEADLRGANLAGAQLQEANLVGAQLDGATLAGAQLQHADLAGASLKAATLSDGDSGRSPANLQRARADHRTVWPVGFDPIAAGVVFVDETQGASQAD